MKQLVSTLALIVAATCVQAADEKGPRAARSVHWGWPAPEAELFAISMVVEKSVPGSYFMAAGWNTGYFGIQELGKGKKVIIFSVWDPTKGDDPNKVKTEERVECLFSDPAMRIKRFGGEGTGGQCMGNFEWKIGETNRFLVRSIPDGEKTTYTGYVYEPRSEQWRKLVTFRTRTGGQPLKGLYSFVEDFRRDYKSANEARRARFGGGWVKGTNGHWTALARGRFTASNSQWEAKETINAGLNKDWFFLETGGDTRQELSLRTVLTNQVMDVELPDFTK